MSSIHKTHVVILDDHQSIIDGYLYRLSQTPDIEVVGTATSADDLEPLLAHGEIDVLILDVYVRTSRDNPNPYPILAAIPNWLHSYPDLNILVISMYNQSSLINAVMEAGASGYILKEDQDTIQELGNIIRAIVKGGIHLSQQAYQQLFKKLSKEFTLTTRQLEALSMCAAFPNATTSELARLLGVANSTMRNLLSGAYLRLNVNNRAAAIAKARELGLITPQKPNLDFLKPD